MTGKRGWPEMNHSDLEDWVMQMQSRARLTFPEQQKLDAARERLRSWRVPTRTVDRPIAEGARGILRGRPKRGPRQLRMEFEMNDDAGDKKVEETKAENGASKKKSSPRKVRPKKPSLKVDTVEKAVELYNEMVTTAKDLGIEEDSVSSFADLGSGKKACEQLHARIDKARSTEGSSDMRKSTSARKSSARKSSQARKAVTSKRTSKNPRSRLDPDAKVTWSGKDNPFREGSDAFKRVEIVRKGSGQSVKTLQGKLGDFPTVTTCARLGLVKVA